VKNVHRAIQPSTYGHLAGGTGQRLMAPKKLIEVVIITHNPVVPDAAQLLETENISQILAGRQADMQIFFRMGAWANFLFSFSMKPPCRIMFASGIVLAPRKRSSFTKRSW